MEWMVLYGIILLPLFGLAMNYLLRPIIQRMQLNLEIQEKQLVQLTRIADALQVSRNSL